MWSKTGRVKITLLFAAVLFQFGLLDLKKYAVRAEEDSEEKKDEAAEDTGNKDDEAKDEDTDSDADDGKKDKDADGGADADEAGESVAEGSCPRPYFREYCSEEKPCCLFKSGSYGCQKVVEEGGNCTQNAFAYNNKDCFCKQGLFCVDGKCTSKPPQKQKEEEF